MKEIAFILLIGNCIWTQPAPPPEDKAVYKDGDNIMFTGSSIYISGSCTYEGFRNETDMRQYLREHQVEKSAIVLEIAAKKEYAVLQRKKPTHRTKLITK